MAIRVKNTRTGRTVTAHNGKDAANIVKIELDRRSGMAVSASKK